MDGYKLYWLCLVIDALAWVAQRQYNRSAVIAKRLKYHGRAKNLESASFQFYVLSTSDFRRQFIISFIDILPYHLRTDTQIRTTMLQQPITKRKRYMQEEISVKSKTTLSRVVGSEFLRRVFLVCFNTTTEKNSPTNGLFWLRFLHKTNSQLLL